MMREIEAQDIQPGDVVALPFGKRATVASVRIGRQFVTVNWVDPYQPSRYSRHQPVLLEGDQ